MVSGYSNELNIQIMIALLKAHEVHKIICSPGSTNISLVASMTYDGSFEMYSSVDERSAAYLACGMAAETGEPVALSCTGATASRNYIPGLTEAFYRHLPILAITSTQPLTRIGNDFPQVIDRTAVLRDMVRMSVQIPVIKDAEDEWGAILDINRALLELRHNEGGPVHINLAATLTESYGVSKLPDVRVIKRHAYNDKDVPTVEGKVVIYVGSHSVWDKELEAEVEHFCEKYDAVVMGNHICNYKGKYYANTSLLCSQDAYESPNAKIDLMIHMGDISGAHIYMHPDKVWRIDSDGLVKDTFKRLTDVFEMDEISFFKLYNHISDKEIIQSRENSQYENWLRECNEMNNLIPELPFSNIWVAQHSISRIPNGSSVHFGIFNTLRVWDFFDLPKGVAAFSNTGGFGIDGGYSAAVGASLANPEKIVFIVAGDLGFFYDMNVLGNRHIGNNIRIMLINNGKGTEFRQYNHRAHVFGDKADEFIAAAGHYGNKSENLVKNYCTALGFTYLSATNKEEFIGNLETFFEAKRTVSMMYEVFIDSVDESEALWRIRNIKRAGSKMIKSTVKNLIGEENTKRLKRIIRQQG